MKIEDFNILLLNNDFNFYEEKYLISFNKKFFKIYLMLESYK